MRKVTVPSINNAGSKHLSGNLMFNAKTSCLNSFEACFNGDWISVIDVETGLDGKKLERLWQIIYGVDVFKHFTAETPITNAVNTTGVGFIPLVLLVCISSA
jgi:hypothetical protein